MLLAAATVAVTAFTAKAQTDATLFTVGNDEVKVSEFKYIYEKNNGSKADYSSKSLNEYLNLYENFKLKVKKAKELGLNTDEKLKTELDGYRKQLSASYLTDREIVEKLVKEAYQRSKKDVHISHILFSVKAGADAATDKTALDQANALKGQLTAANFGEMAKQKSNDPSAAKNSGDVGFFTVFQLPYALETAIYNAKDGEILGPIRTSFGYHLVLVHGSRAARGQVQAAHILLRTKAGDDAKNKAAAATIQTVYKELQGGSAWNDLVTKYSEDNGTKSKEGVIGWFGINKYDAAFENAAFGLLRDGDYTQPFESSAGWHIVKRTKRLENPTYEESKTELSAKVKKDERFGQVQTALVERIKKDNNFKIYEDGRSAFLKTLTGDFMTYKWKKGTDYENLNMFSVGDRMVSLKEFAEFAERNPVQRTQTPPGAVSPLDPIAAALDRSINEMTTKIAMEYEEKSLDAKYPDYRALMREYEEGILLFEATKKLVWDKASSDEDGLKAFYDKNTNKYKWPERYKITTYTIKSTDEKVIAGIRKAAKKKNGTTVGKLFNEKEAVVAFEEGTFEKTKNPALAKLKGKKGEMSEAVSKDGTTTFIKVEAIVPSGSKTLAEARGYVVADYQDFLEKEWVKELRTAYPVKLNDATFNALIKK